MPKAQSVQQRRAKCAIRNSRFTGTFKTNTTVGTMYLGATPTARPDANTQSKRKVIRKKDLPDQGLEKRSAVGRCDVLVELDKFAMLFIEVGFNSLIGTVTYDFSMESAAIEQNDDTNFTALSSWMMRYYRNKEKGRIASLPKRPKPEKKPEGAHEGATGKEGTKEDGGVDKEGAAGRNS